MNYGVIGMNNKYLSLFSGIGGFEVGIKNSSKDFECVGCSEIDKYATSIYEQHFDHHNFGDITKVDASDLPDFDLLVGGFPCFVAGSKVRTQNGLKNIEDINKNDLVLTKNGYYKVENVMVKSYNDVGNKIVLHQKGDTFPIECTKNHPFYVRHKDGSKEWVNAEDITPKEDFVFIPVSSFNNDVYSFTYTYGVNQYKTKEETAVLDDPNWWWCVGYYIGDGWRRKRRTRNGKWCSSTTITLATNPLECDKVMERFSKNFVCSAQKDKRKITFNDKVFYNFVKTLGDGASNKHFPKDFEKLNRKCLEALLDGYIYADGHDIERGFACTSTSKQLIEDVFYTIVKLYGDTPYISFHKTPDTYIIEGRVVNQKDYWQLRFIYDKKRFRNFYIDDEGVWIKVKSNKIIDLNCLVYNLEVEQEHNYTVNDVLVHNCQAFSVAGQQKGFEDTRGTLFFDIVRILSVKKPKYFLLENVKNLLSHDKGKTFTTMITILIGLGYKVRWDVLNSKDFGVPQSRERIYIRGSLDKLPNDISLTEDKSDNSIKYILNGRQGERILSSDGLTTTLAATGGNAGGRTFVKESKIQKIGNHSASGRGQGGNIYDEEGLSPTLTCQHDYPAKVRIKKVYGSMQAHRAETDGSYAPTLTASMGGGGGQKPIIETEYAYRAITPIECERLQGFEDNWTKYGEDNKLISNTQRYKCLGNAVTTNVIQYIIDNWNIGNKYEDLHR